MERSKASIRAEFGPIIADYLASGGTVTRYSINEHRLAR